MSWTTPKTWAVGDVLTAADMNTHVRDNMRWVGHASTGGAPMCRRYHNATVTGIATATDLSFNTDVFTPIGFDPVATTGNTLIGKVSVGVSSGVQGMFVLGVHIRASLTWASGTGLVQVGIRDVALTNVIARQHVAVDHSTSVNISCVTGWNTQLATGSLTFAAPLDYNNYTNVDITSSADYSPEFWAVWVGRGA